MFSRTAGFEGRDSPGNEDIRNARTLPVAPRDPRIGPRKRLAAYTDGLR